MSKKQEAALPAHDRGPFLEACSEVHQTFHRLHWILEKALSLNTECFIPKTSAHSRTSQGIWPLRIAEFLSFLLCICIKAPKFSPCSDASEMRERTVFTARACALYNQSFADKPPGLRRLKRTDSLSLHVPVFYPPPFPSHTNQRLLLPAMLSRARAVRPRSCVTTGGFAFKVWATFLLIHRTPTEQTILRVGFLPSTTSNISDKHHL